MQQPSSATADSSAVFSSPADGKKAVAVEFKQVSKSFGVHQVIQQVDLSVAVGEVVAVCGPSGSGKSTLIRLINHLETLSSGEIFIHQRPTAGLSGKALRQLRTHIGFVFQQFNLYAHLDALDNVSLALTKVHGWKQDAARHKARELLVRVGLADRAHHFPSQLSGGQQQRVAIARALVTDPNIILFDEPTSALDPEMIGEVLLVMQELAHSGITMIVVTHEMSFAREIADRVVFMDGGQILEQADPESFFTQPQHPRARRFLQKVLFPLRSAQEQLAKEGKVDELAP
ncbi:amino acid ABC transporter ATP-binding protein [Ewingella americana]|uniref:ATP-binding component of an ABC superfamily phosphate transporter n=1 Tax=Ewingella americana (strain ATCC 33852 / DSM 4580 / CCUG 14506 / JCM 5911 / LMG 7869 / NCTC 12157 / CDC 1468-78) TaxID=910964 RepID=A0A085GIH5_EWIA3|nr:amino acid ABC transporter ATP-binding protein [Ewingella americana]KAA8729279.1 amino acid ABC transporter ATP-binding protein [Ewingella americana]KFC83520.1 ATP-binding component of an ABC superfamily phosphate transporter [Ewingella americana ATCC 33852]